MKIQVKARVSIVVPATVTAYFGIDAELARDYLGGDQDVDVDFLANGCTVDKVEPAHVKPSTDEVGQHETLADQLAEFFASVEGQAALQKALEES